MEKTFEPASVEARLYRGWEQSGAFAANPESSASPYTIMIPPPNVTGSLHVGHALTMTLQDIFVRFRRMQGRDVLWQPGTDHAGIATQMVVERLLDKEGVSRKQLGRETFLSRVWQWKAESGGTITQQLRRLGASPDWARERFTMDDGLSDAVREVFCTLFEQGLIYQDKRLVNWDTVLGTAISDLEVESRETKGHMWHIRYPVDGGEEIIVATTRPETMLADTAVAVHPENEKFKHLIGRHVVLPLTERRIPIIADEYADPEKGTGAVKITPAHDFNDFEVGKRHGLPMPSMLDRQGKVTLAELGELPEFVRSLEGKDRFVARKEIVAELEARELLVEVKPHPHTVPHGDRSGSVIEPLLTTQWYCNAWVLAQPAIKAVENGDIKFVPQQWENTFFAWMRDIQPWCISRQLWWGHRIPAWYDESGKVYVARTEAEAQAQAGEGVKLAQDEDVLDTWFSSALWPFSTLGWPEKTPELEKYYPTDTLVTGFDIIFFWVARMIMMGMHFMGDVPFRTVYIHGLVRDEKGQKMSKSKGNVLDPLTLIDAYGADALRYSVAAAAGQGRDVKLGQKIVENNRAFITKIWNAARFLEMNGVKPNPAFRPEEAKLPLCRWILAQTNEAVAAGTAALDAFQVSAYAQSCYRLVWDNFCDWFIEFAKPGFATDDAAEIRDTAAYVLGVLLRLMHPLIPYVTEELWDYFGYGPECSLINAPWPKEIWPDSEAKGKAALDSVEVQMIMNMISEVRTVRSEMNVPPSVKSPLLFKDIDNFTWGLVNRWHEAFSRMARAAEIERLSGEVPKAAAQVILPDATIVLPLEGLIDFDAERKRLANALAKAQSELSKVEHKLANADFVARAPEEVLMEHQDRLRNFGEEVKRLEAALARIS
ncbi:MAG: valine--tRNA ligase [Acidocella sp.]|uniref:valine--tRNA ligase n=1 Tax=Acidocella sp. TaxID=50710 RepID=UPI003FC42E62